MILINNIAKEGAISLMQHAGRSVVEPMLFSPALVNLCGQIAPVASLAVVMAPLPTMRQIRRDQSVGDLPILPYSSMILSTFLWTVYGLLKHEPNVWITNGLGCAFGLCYFAQFSKFAPASDKGIVRQHRNFVGAALLTTTLLFLSNSVSVIGSAAVALCIALFGSPLVALKRVLETKSAKSIPLPFTVASVLSCFCWTVFGFFKMGDPKIYRTNALGLSFALAQVLLKIIYGGRSEAQDKVGQSSPVGAM